MNKFKPQEYRDEFQGVRCPIVPMKTGNAAGGKGTRSNRPYTGHTQTDAEPSKRVTTKRERMSQLSVENPEMVFRQLMHHFSEKNLRQWYNELSGRAAQGTDGINKVDYGIHLQENLKILHGKLKQMSYRPSPVRQVWIPKEGQPKKLRPLGISNFEDKIVQKGVQQVLEAIYDPLFSNRSFGFRPKRSCHDAVKDLRSYLYKEPVREIIDMDLSNYFGTINHDLLMGLLSEKIQDQRFLRYIKRMLKAGILDDGNFTVSDEGVPQGSVCSPVLANIFAHYALDEWFESTVQKHCRGKVALFRYADDAVICCEYQYDAIRIRKVLTKRLSKYRLKLNEEKTHTVCFDRDDRGASGCFDFLGFSFYLGLSKSGRVIPKVKSSAKKIRVKLKRVNLWCKENRNKFRLRELWKQFCSKLRGHVQYYGVSFNGPAIHRFCKRAIFIFLKWLNRRSQKRSLNYEQLKLYMKVYPPPKIQICHRLY